MDWFQQIIIMIVLGKLRSAFSASFIRSFDKIKVLWKWISHHWQCSISKVSDSKIQTLKYPLYWWYYDWWQGGGWVNDICISLTVCAHKSEYLQTFQYAALSNSDRHYDVTDRLLHSLPILILTDCLLWTSKTGIVWWSNDNIHSP